MSTTPCPNGGSPHRSGIVGRKTCDRCDYPDAHLYAATTTTFSHVPGVDVEHEVAVPASLARDIVDITLAADAMVIGCTGSVTLRLVEADVTKYAREPWRTEVWHFNTGMAFTVIRFYDDEDAEATYKVTNTNP